MFNKKAPKKKVDKIKFFFWSSQAMETMETNQSKEDAIAAKREARRRKVLENAKDRLSRITGREHNDDDDNNRTASK